MKKKSKKKTIIALIAAGAAAVIAITVVLPMFTGRTNAAEAVTSMTMTAMVERGTIETTVVGSGSLASDSTVDITIPSELTMASVLISENDTVQEGDVLAVIDTASLEDALSNIQSELDAIDTAIDESADDTDNEVIEAAVTGRIKEIYVNAGDNVQSVIAEHDSLLLLSVDGTMKLSFRSDKLGELKAGDDVTVTLADDTTKTGTIQSIADGACVVTLTDNGPEAGEEATVSNDDDEVLGSGTLEISSPIEVLVTDDGTVESVNVETDEYVDSGDTLFTLTETVSSSNYQAQIARRGELENTLKTLLAYSQSNTITAPASGMVSAINVSASDNSGSAADDSSDIGDTGNMNLSAVSDEEASVTTPDDTNGGAAFTLLSASTVGDGAFTLLATETAAQEITATEAATDGGEAPAAPSADTPADESVTEAEIEIQPLAIGGEIQVYINNPATGSTPQSTVMPGRGYTGTLTWSPAAMQFEEKTTYSAMVTLTADAGYQFDASAVPVVTGGQVDAASLINDGASLSFTVVFAPTSASSNNMNSSNQQNSNQTQQQQPQQSNAQQSNSGSVTGGGAVSSGSSGGGAATEDSAADTAVDTESVTTQSAFTINTGQEIYLTADVDELDILTLEVGQTASVVLDALPDQTLTGEVTQISDAGTSQSGVTTYPVTILVNVPDDVTVKLGMNASATIVTGSSENALIIPVAALQEMNGETFVMIASGEETATTGNTPEEASAAGDAEDGMPGGFGEMRAVTTGLSDGNNVEILSGLEEGETITYMEITDSESEQQMGGFMMSGMGGGMSGGMGDRPDFGDGEMPQGGPPQQ